MKGLNCKGDFCEEVINSENSPKDFVPYHASQVTQKTMFSFGFLLSKTSPTNTENTENVDLAIHYEQSRRNIIS